MSIGVPAIGFYFVNGMANTDGHGSKATEVIQEVLQKAPEFQEGRVFVTFHLNDAAPAERVLLELVGAVGGAVALGYSINKELKKQGDKTSRFSGFLGALALTGAGYDYVQMQEDKNRIATELANRVSIFLGENELNIANLILHSQGADIGYRALDTLSEYKHRIRVITLGAMTTIPNDMCSQVENYKFKNDWISRVLALPFESRRQANDAKERSVTDLEKEGILAHDVHSYIQEKRVRERLVSLLA